MRCSVLQRVKQRERQQEHDSVLQSVAECCSLLQCVAVCCRERNNTRIAAGDLSVCHMLLQPNMLLQPISLQGDENALGCIVLQQVSFCKRFCRFFFNFKKSPRSSGEFADGHLKDLPFFRG